MTDGKQYVTDFKQWDTDCSLSRPFLTGKIALKTGFKTLHLSQLPALCPFASDTVFSKAEYCHGGSIQLYLTCL